MKKNRFGAEEKLKSQKTIKSLFESSQTAFSYPIKAFYFIESIETNIPSLPKAGVSVSKRKFKKAVDRNLLKRRMREAYRLNKEAFVDHFSTSQMNVLFVYIGETEETYLTIEKGMKKILKSMIYGSKSH